MLGEVALVPKESPINQSGLMFFNTLFDENACCHVAAGAGFSEVLDGFMDMSDEEILAKGVNDSLIHVDFMVGSDDLHIVGIHEDGSETDVFVNGTWLSNLNNHRPILPSLCKTPPPQSYSQPSQQAPVRQLLLGGRCRTDCGTQ